MLGVALRSLFYFYFSPLILLSEEEIRQFWGRGAFHQNPSLYVGRGKDFKFLSVDDSRHGEWLTAALLGTRFLLVDDSRHGEWLTAALLENGFSQLMTADSEWLTTVRT